jgi:hypothetical protein
METPAEGAVDVLSHFVRGCRKGSLPLMVVEREMRGWKIVPRKISVLHLVFPEAEEGRRKKKCYNDITSFL